jgi:hypothetical protein
LPDGFFSDQKSQFGYISEDLGMENAAIYILVISTVLVPMCPFLWHFVIF